MNEVVNIIRAAEQYKQQHGVFPKQVRVSPELCKELQLHWNLPVLAEISKVSNLEFPSALSLDWYEDASVTELERFRLTV
jgi:hypothetical protein